MRCMFCDKDIINGDLSFGLPITVPGRGVAHTYCAERDLQSRRIFGNIHIADLEDSDLLELKQMVNAEIDQRRGVTPQTY